MINDLIGSNNLDVKVLSDKQILERIIKYEKVWEMTKEISDLNHYSELIREVTKREFEL